MKLSTNDVIDILQAKKKRSDIGVEESLVCNSVTLLHGRWSNEEHNQFIEACLLYGDNWNKIRSHCQKYIKKLAKNNKEVQRRLNNLMTKHTDFSFQPLDIDKLTKEEKEDIIVWIFAFKKHRNNKRLKNNLYFKFDQSANFFHNNNNENYQKDKNNVNNASNYKTKLSEIAKLLFSESFCKDQAPKETQSEITKQIIQKQGILVDLLLQQRKVEEPHLKIDSGSIQKRKKGSLVVSNSSLFSNL